MISGDGAYVAFFGNASDLVAGDGTGADVFLGEVATGTLVAASRRDPGTAWAPVTGNEVSFLGPSRFRSISGDGAYVAFLSSATDLVAGGSGPASQNVYVWDRASGTTTLVSESVSAAGQRGNGTSQMAVISGDGAFVAFLSTATDLVSGGSGPSAQNVYVWERSSGTTTLVSESVAAAGQRGNSHSYNPVISGDGTIVAFFSQATDLVLGGSGPAGNPDVYVWERSSGMTTLVSESVAVAGQRGNGYSYNPVISGDGATVAFYSYATDLVPGGSGPSTSNVYLWERSSGTTTLVSGAVSAAGQRGNGSSSEPVISGNGAYVAFLSSATDLVAGGSGPSTQNVYVWDRASGTTTLVSESLSVAGQRGDSDSYQPAISGNGTTVAFFSYATDLVPGGSGPSNVNVYVWERSSGTTKLVSESVSMAGQRGDSDSYDPVLSGDGAAVAFTSQATDLVAGGSGPPAQNAYVWDRSSGTTTLVSESVSAAGQRGDGDSSQPVISGDGEHVAFQSDATDLISRDFNYTTDVFLWSSGAPVDTTPPSDPVIGSTLPAASIWSNDNTVDVAWSGASDEVDGSGLAGYSIEWNTTPISTPNTVVDVAHTADPHSTTSPPLGDGNAHYFHLSTCDLAGNCTSTVHAGPFWIDTAAPSAPGTISSSSHAVGIPSPDDTISVAWAGATDATSGIYGYSVEFDGSPSSACETTADVDEATLAATSPALAPGTWYVHLCAVDRAGNWGAVAHAGPFLVDSSAPPSAMKLYYTDYGLNVIRRIGVDGLGETLVRSETQPFALDLDPGLGQLYWISRAPNAVRRSSTDGSGATSLVTAGHSGPYGVALDLAGDKIYWSDNATGKVRRANLDGTAAEDFMAGVAGPVGIALDPVHRNLYVAAFSGGTILRRSLDGGGTVAILAGLTSVHDVAVDPVHGHLYWTQHGFTGSVRRANLDASGVVVIRAGESYPSSLAVDPVHGYIYWVQELGGTIRRVKTDGSDLVTIRSGLSNPVGLVLDRGDTTPPSDPTIDSPRLPVRPGPTTTPSSGMVRRSGRTGGVRGRGLLDGVEHHAGFDSGRRRRRRADDGPALDDAHRR